MKTQNIKLGNLLNHKEDGLVIIDSIQLDKLSHNDIRYWNNASEYSPILTEKYISKISEPYFQTRNIQINDEDGNIIIDCVRKKAWIEKNEDEIEIKYPQFINTLQNLYFSLAGNELDISSILY